EWTTVIQRVTSKSSNQPIITSATTGRGGRSMASLPSMTGPSIGTKSDGDGRTPALAGELQPCRFLDVDWNRRSLRRGQVESSKVLALRRRRLVAQQPV